MKNFYLFQLTRAVMILWKSFWNQVSSSKIFKIAIFFFFIPPFSPIFRCIIIIWCSRPQQSKRKTRWCDLKCFWWGGFYHTKNEILCIICMYSTHIVIIQKLVEIKKMLCQAVLFWDFYLDKKGLKKICIHFYWFRFGTYNRW